MCQGLMVHPFVFLYNNPIVRTILPLAFVRFSLLLQKNNEINEYFVEVTQLTRRISYDKNQKDNDGIGSFGTLLMAIDPCS